MSFNKYLYRKIIAAATALTMVFAATGCGESTSWIAKCNDTEVNAGVYIFYQTEAYSEATSKLKKGNEELDISDVKLLKTMTVENTDITEWINNRAEKQLKVFMGVNEKFDELGLELSAEDSESIKNTVDMYWGYYAEQYETNGIGKDSFKALVEYDYKRDMVLDYYYGEGGEKECSDNEISAYLEGNYARVKTISFSFKDAEGNDLDEDGKKEVKKLAEEYKKKADSGVSFDKLIKEYSDYQAKLAEEVAAAAAEAAGEESDSEEEPAVTTAPVTTAADEDAEVTTTASEEESAEDAAEETESEDETAEDEASDDEADADEEEAAVTTAAEGDAEPEVTTTAADETEPEDEEDSDPYANENIYKKGSEDDGYTPTEKINKAVFEEIAVDKTAVIEEEDGIYLIKRLSIVDRKDFFEGDKKSGIIAEMNKDNFDNMAAEWAEAYGTKFNEPALKRYDPFNIKM